MKKCLLAVALLFGNECLVSESVSQVEAVVPIQFPEIGQQGTTNLTEFFSFFLSLIGTGVVNAAAAGTLDLQGAVDAAATDVAGNILRNVTGRNIDLIRENLGMRYLGDRQATLPQSIECMVKFMQEVREGALYDFAKAVGRINVDGYTGTGTVVEWDCMPDELKGKVVLTAGHNFPAHVRKDEIGRSRMFVSKDLNSVWFTPDTSEDICTWGSNQHPAGIQVRDGYLFKTEQEDEAHQLNDNNPGPDDDENLPGSFSDVAVFVLRDAVPPGVGRVNLGNLHGSIFQDEDCFTVGYGLLLLTSEHGAQLGEVQHPIVGWNVKKKTKPQHWSPNRTYPNAPTYDYGPEHVLFLGGSDSGSPIVREIHGNYEMVGIHTGGRDYSIQQIKRQLVAIGHMNSPLYINSQPISSIPGAPRLAPEPVHAPLNTLVEQPPRSLPVPPRVQFLQPPQ